VKSGRFVTSGLDVVSILRLGEGGAFHNIRYRTFDPGVIQRLAGCIR
jgi:hypothetical protein